MLNLILNVGFIHSHSPRLLTAGLLTSLLLLVALTVPQTAQAWSPSPSLGQGPQTAQANLILYTQARYNQPPEPLNEFSSNPFSWNALIKEASLTQAILDDGEAVYQRYSLLGETIALEQVQYFLSESGVNTGFADILLENLNQGRYKASSVVWLALRHMSETTYQSQK